MLYTDPNGEWILPVLGFLVGGYLAGSAANDWEWNPGKWDNSIHTWSAVFLGGVAGAIGCSYLFGPGGVIAGGTPLNISLGFNINNVVAPLAQFTVSNSGIILNGAGYITAAGGGMWLTSNMLSGKESQGPYMDMTMVNNHQGSFGSPEGWYFGVQFDDTGSVYFENRAAAYDYMWEKSFQNGRPKRELAARRVNQKRTIK